MGPLKTIGLIRSTRGSYGGFALAEPTSKINMKEVVHALEGSLYLVECVEDSSICRRADTCVTRGIWSAMSKSILQVLEAVTLKDMVENQKNSKRSHLRYDI